MRPTRRGGALLVVAVLLSAFGGWGRYPLPTMLGAAALAAVLVAPLFAAGRVRARVDRAVEPDRVQRGRPAQVRLRVRNDSDRRQAAFQVTDSFGGVTRTVAVDGLAAGAEAVHHYELPTRARGRFDVGPLVLHRADPFGLVRRRAVTGDTATVRVLPRQLPARPPAAGHVRHHGGATDVALRGSADQQDVREYVPGDEVRHLHWKATARTGRLMVRDLAEPRPGLFTVLLDTRTGILTPDAFEEAVDVAASLTCAAARAGQRARLLTPAGLDLPVHGGPPAVRMHLDALCELRQAGTADDALAPALLPTGGALVAVSGEPGVGDVPLRLRQRFAEITMIIFPAPGTAGSGAEVRVAGGRVAGSGAGGRVAGGRVAGSGAGGRAAGGRVAGSGGGMRGVRVVRVGDAQEAVRRWNATVR